MPTYRDPATGRLFFRPSPFSEPTSLGTPGGSWSMRSHGHGPRSSSGGGSRGHSVRAHSGGGAPHAQSAPAPHHMDLSEFLPATHSTEAVVSNHQNIARPRRRVPRKARPGGKITALAFYTLGDDDMSPVWKDYASAFVGTRGPVFGVISQQDAAKQLNALHDTNIRDVYFVGHGFDDSVQTGPAFMLSGKREWSVEKGHWGFYTHGHTDWLLQGKEGPLLRALAPHLSIEGQVVLAFMSCHTGKDKIFQHAVATILCQLEPALDVKVYGYRDIYRVARDYSRNAHLARDRPKGEKEFEVALSNSHADPNESESDRLVRHDEAGYRRASPNYRAPDRPITHLVVEVKNGMDIDPTTDDPFADFDAMGNDPIAGLDL